MSNPSIVSGYNLTGLLPQHWQDWDDYYNRLGRYNVFDGYYHNVAYHSIMHYAESLKHVERLYKHVRGVYNPVARQTELYVSKIYGGMLDTQTGKEGAIPVKAEDDRLYAALIALWKASRWNQKKSLYVRNGAKFGDSFIKIVDDIELGTVYMEPVDPRKVKDIQTDSAGRITYAELEYIIPYSSGSGNQREATYTEIITPDTFTTMIDGQPAALSMNGRGEMVSEWANEYGFVPMVSTQHRDVGLTYGGNAFYFSMHKINELNDIASILNDGARRQVNMPLFTFGQRLEADLGSDQSTSSTNKDDKPRKDTMSVIQMHTDARVEALPPVISISDTLGLVTEILNEIERDMPELSLHRLREGGNLTAPGVRSAYDDAIARIQEARGNYDAGLVEAQKIAVAIGGMRGYDGYQGFSLMSLENGQLEHYVDNRPVINDSLSKNEKVTLTLQAMSSGAPVSVYRTIGWSEDEATEIINAQQANTTSFISQFGAPQDPTPPEAPADAVANEGIAQVSEADILDAELQLEAVA